MSLPDLKGDHLLPQDSGEWWNSKMLGQGLSVHVGETDAVIYWFTFGVNGREWYEIRPSCDGYDIFQTFGGTADRPQDAVLDKVGEARITKRDEYLVMIYETMAHHRGALVCDEHVSSDAGIYFDPDLNGEGFVLGDLYGYYFTYGVYGGQEWFYLLRQTSSKWFALRVKGDFNRWRDSVEFYKDVEKINTEKWNLQRINVR